MSIAPALAAALAYSRYAAAALAAHPEEGEALGATLDAPFAWAAAEAALCAAAAAGEPRALAAALRRLRRRVFGVGPGERPFEGCAERLLLVRVRGQRRGGVPAVGESGGEVGRDGH